MNCKCQKNLLFTTLCPIKKISKESNRSHFDYSRDVDNHDDFHPCVAGLAGAKRNSSVN